MERRMKSKQSYHTRSKSLGEEPVEFRSSSHLPRQTTYDDYHARNMEVDTGQDVWMNSFSSWKMRRMKATSTERDRKAERDEVEETQEKLKKRKSKTFREIVEEKQRREKFLQGGSVDLGSLDSGEITQILADLPSTNLDSDNEQDIFLKPDPIERKKETSQEKIEPAKEPDRKKEIRQRSNTLPSNYPKPDVKITKVPPPVKPKPRLRSGSLRNRSNSVGEKLYEPEVITVTNTYTTYASLPPSMEREEPKPVVKRDEPKPDIRREEFRPTTRREEPRPIKKREEPRPVTTREEPRQVVNREEPRPAMEQEAPRQSFHDKLLKARQNEEEATLSEQKAKEEARKPYKPRKSSIFDKIRAFDSGQAFIKSDTVDGDNSTASRVETKQKPLKRANHNINSTTSVLKKAEKQNVEVDEDYEDLVIIMSQSKMSQRGFGFQTSGGYDEGKPLVVSRVTAGSVADYSDLKVGDHILSINKENTRRFNQEDVQQCLSQSILSGKLTCKVRRYQDGKVPPAKTAPTSEPVFQRSITPKFESLPPVHAPPRTQSVPVHQPVKREPPEPAKVVEKTEKDQNDDDIDVLRPDPTRNALARARQMLDKLEMDDDETESSSRSSDTADHSPVSSMGSSSYTSNKPQHRQPPQTNGYHAPHSADQNSVDDESVSSEDVRQPPSWYKQPNRPTLQAQVRVNSPPSSLDGEGFRKNEEPQLQFSFKSFSAPKPYKDTDKDSLGRENAAPGSDSDDQTKKRDYLNQRRNDFFREMSKDGPKEKVDEYGNVKEVDGRFGGVEEPIRAQNEDTAEMMPVRRPIKPHTAHRKPFNREEERKRLEKWSEEQEKRRQEKYELEQQRLKEEQERAMQMAVEDIQKKREEEEKALEEKRRMMQKQQEEMREMRRKQMEEEENRRKAKLEQERLAREEAERQRQEEEKRREKEREEEQRRERERQERERILREEAEKERQEREKERKEQEERERLQREREERERAAKEKIRKEQEEYARMLKEREKERQEQERLKAEQEQKRQEEEDAERERLQVEKWKKESEDRERAAREKLEQDHAQQEEIRRRLEEEERARIREEEREKMRREWEEERKRELDQLQKEKDKLQKEKEALAKKHEDERQMLRAERERMAKELEQKKAYEIEEPIGKMTNGEVMSSPPKTELEIRHSPRNSYSPRTVSPGSQRIKENNQKNMVPERDHPSSHSIMSHYKDPNIPTSQHWLFEEAERRRRAEEQGLERKLPPDVVIPPPQKDMAPPQKPPHSIPRHINAYPRGFEPEHPTRIPPQRKDPEVPASNAPVMRRMRRPEAEADRQRKMQNRRSLPDLGGGKDSAVPSNGYREDPPSRNSARAVLNRALSNENVNKSAFTPSYQGQSQFMRRPSYEVQPQYNRQPPSHWQPQYTNHSYELRPTQYHRHPVQPYRQPEVPSAVYAASNLEMGPRVQMYASEPRSFTARTVTATKQVSSSPRYSSSSSSEKEFNFKPIEQGPKMYSSKYYMDV